nr:RpiB/LacA/LacB family sugar-phosphate isomerase [Brachyspira hyodysenteriae]
MKIAIGCDHSAVDLKKDIIKYLEELGHTVTDFGTHTTESVDYPIYGKKGSRCHCKQRMRMWCFNMRNWYRHFTCC